MAANKRSAPRSAADDRPVVIDELDKAIVEALQEDGRLPYTRLATVVGLSEAAVRQRVQRLIEGGVVQIVAVTDPLTLGFRRTAMIGLKVDGDLRIVADAGLGTINAVRLCAEALRGFQLVVALNRFDPADELHTRNRSWLADAGFELLTDPELLAARLHPPAGSR